MLLRMIFDDSLAQAAYLIGCQRTGEALLIDPERDVDRYIRAAEKEGLRITAVTETHIHADFLSGARELAERTGAKVYLSDEGDAEWKYGWLGGRAAGGSYPHRLLKDGDTFTVGNIEFKAMHTPGHTPEHLCFLVTDRGGGAGEPMGIATGDFVFVGDLGRPDLLESAAGKAGSKVPSARRLYHSVQGFSKLPEYLQVWPAHGAGSACGKALGAVPQSTVGYERRFNPSIRAATSEDYFVEFILEGQPDPPAYFARMKRLNRDGPRLLGDLPRPVALPAGQLGSLDASTAAIIDTRTWKAFSAGHLPGSLYIPLDKMFPTVAGSFIDEHERIILVVDAARMDEAVRNLVRIGLDRVESFITPAALEQHAAGGGRMATSVDVDPDAVKDRAGDDDLFFLDVRNTSEFQEGHIPGAHSTPYTRLAAHLSELPRDRQIIVNCRSGGRSSRAVAFLERAGFRAANLAGGFLAWEKSAPQQVER
jgi:hydroxyacylglutathione hydrolase